MVNCLPCELGDTGPQNPGKKLAVVVGTYDSNCGEVETGGSLGFHSHPASPNWVSPKLRIDGNSKVQVDGARDMVLNLWVATPSGLNTRYPVYQIFTLQFIYSCKITVIK